MSIKALKVQAAFCSNQGEKGKYRAASFGDAPPVLKLYPVMASPTSRVGE